MDFTIKRYTQLLHTLKKSNYKFQTFEQFIVNPLPGKVAILRHDIDRLPKNALLLAKIEHSLDIKASYYFRMIKGIWDESIALQIKEIGHEIGYHYEDVRLTNGDLKKAMKLFKQHLAIIQNVYPVKTICMHGSPMSKWDSKILWNTYDYKSLGIIGEPYFDVNYAKVLYITDTGRKWNNQSISVRDKIQAGKQDNLQFSFKFKSTNDIIIALQKSNLPEQIMINTHPHRWFVFGIYWVKEYVMQSIKNIVKWAMIKIKRQNSSIVF